MCVVLFNCRIPVREVILQSDLLLCFHPANSPQFYLAQDAHSLDCFATHVMLYVTDALNIVLTPDSNPPNLLRQPIAWIAPSLTSTPRSPLSLRGSSDLRSSACPQTGPVSRILPLLKYFPRRPKLDRKADFGHGCTGWAFGSGEHLEACACRQVPVNVRHEKR